MRLKLLWNKMITGAFLLCLMGLHSKMHGQNVTMVLNIVTNDFTLSTTDQWSISIVNASALNYACYLKVDISAQGEGNVASGTSKGFKLSAFNTKLINSTSEELFDSSTVNYSSFYRDAVILTGQLPSRNYTVCVDLLDIKTNQLINRTCSSFQLQKYQPPVNIYPFEGDTVAQNSIIFQWLPPQPVDKAMRYTIKISEVLSIQSKVSTFFSNNYFFTQDNITSTAFQYPVNARKLTPGRTYSWIIEAKIGTLLLKSEPSQFRVQQDKGSNDINVIQAPPNLLNCIELFPNTPRNAQIMKDTINVSFVSDYALDKTPVIFYDASNKPIHSSFIKIKPGKNYLSFDISGNKKIKNEKFFSLVIQPTKDESFMVKIRKKIQKNDRK